MVIGKSNGKETIMITLYRMIKLWQMRVKYRLELYELIEEGMKYISDNREEIEKKFVHEFAEIMHKK